MMQQASTETDQDIDGLIGVRLPLYSDKLLLQKPAAIPKRIPPRWTGPASI
jgi:hypothetical protein